MTWDQNVNAQHTCKDWGESDNGIKIFYHYLHKTALIKQEWKKNDRMANNLSHTFLWACRAHLSYTVCGVHSYVWSFTRSFIQSFTHFSHSVSHNTHQPVL